MKNFAVIGHPISHSLSPLMHNTAFKLLGLDHRYDLLDIEPVSLQKEIERIRKGGWGGFNITVPHKETIMPLIDEIVPAARAIGAVNTVVIRDNILTGYNTDVIGVEKALDPVRSKIEGRPCAIIGSGGAARSVTQVLINDFKIKSITFIALIPEQARSLIDSIGGRELIFNVVPSNDTEIEKAVKSSTLIVNATTIGMFPQNLNSPISNKNWITDQHIVFDVVYRPIKTRLLLEAQGKCATIIGGLDMFIHQGAAAFQLWTGKNMPLEEIRRVLEEKLSS